MIPTAEAAVHTELVGLVLRGAIVDTVLAAAKWSMQEVGVAVMVLED